MNAFLTTQELTIKSDPELSTQEASKIQDTKEIAERNNICKKLNTEKCDISTRTASPQEAYNQ